MSESDSYFDKNEVYEQKDDLELNSAQQQNQSQKYSSEQNINMPQDSSQNQNEQYQNDNNEQNLNNDQQYQNYQEQSQILNKSFEHKDYLQSINIDEINDYDEIIKIYKTVLSTQPTIFCQKSNEPFKLQMDLEILINQKDHPLQATVEWKEIINHWQKKPTGILDRYRKFLKYLTLDDHKQILRYMMENGIEGFISFQTIDNQVSFFSIQQKKKVRQKIPIQKKDSNPEESPSYNNEITDVKHIQESKKKIDNQQDAKKLQVGQPKFKKSFEDFLLEIRKQPEQEMTVQELDNYVISLGPKLYKQSLQVQSIILQKKQQEESSFYFRDMMKEFCNQEDTNLKLSDHVRCEKSINLQGASNIKVQKKINQTHRKVVIKENQYAKLQKQLISLQKTIKEQTNKDITITELVSYLEKVNGDPQQCLEHYKNPQQTDQEWNDYEDQTIKNAKSINDIALQLLIKYKGIHKIQQRCLFIDHQIPFSLY